MSLDFDPNIAWNHILFLAYPRTVGSSGEKQAQEYIRSALEGMGYRVEEEEFALGMAPWHFSRICIILGLCLLGTAWFTADKFPLVAVILLGLILTILAFATRFWLRLIESPQFYRSKLKSKNIICSSPINWGTTGEGRGTQLFFMAHYDSKSQTISLPVRIICLGVVFVSLSALIIILGLGLEQPVYENLCFILAGIAGLRLAIVETRNDSPGALDNASVGILLELARIYRQYPPPGVQLSFIFTGAEEWGLQGAANFLRNHMADSDKGNCLFMNLDGVGIAGKLAYVTNTAGTGTLLPQIKSIAGRLNVPLGQMHMFPGLLMDHLPFARHGFAVLSLCSVGRSSFYIHTPQDDMAKVDLQGIDEAGRVVQNCIYELSTNKNRTTYTG